MRGVLASMAMSGVRSLTTRVGLVRITPPEEIGRHGAAALLARVSPERRAAALELAHWCYGGVGGATFDALPLPRSRLVGIAYGLALWALFEAILAPALGAPKRDRPASERAALAGDHALYGFLLGS